MTMTYNQPELTESGEVLTSAKLNTGLQAIIVMARALGLVDGEAFSNAVGDGNVARSTGTSLEAVPGAAVGKFIRFDNTAHAIWDNAPTLNDTARVKETLRW